MSNGEHDNTNRGALWKRADGVAEGYLDIEGVRHWAGLFTLDAKGENAPKAVLFAYVTGDTAALAIRLWTAKPNTFDQVYSGHTDGHFVNVFKGKGDKPNSPCLQISLKEKQAQAAPAPQAQTPAAAPVNGAGYDNAPVGEDIPF